MSVSEKSPNSDDHSSEVIRRFLEHPHDRACFQAFYDLIYKRTVGYLGYLKKIGYRFPASFVAGDHPLSNLAYDILGAFFAKSTAQRPYPVIFDYFERQRQSKPADADAPNLYALLMGLLSNFTRQELSRLLKQDDPQIANLKKRFKELFKSPRYTSKVLNPSGGRMVFLTQNSQALREDRPLIPYEKLRAAVQAAYLESNNYVDWCRRIFALLEEETDFKNMVKESDILSAAIAVTCDHINVAAWEQAQMPMPKSDLIRQLSQRARDESLLYAKEEVIPYFIAKERISQEEGDGLFDATTLYMTDYAQDGSADLIPVYYRETMPEKYHGEYLKKHKYVLETIINKTVEFFNEKMKEYLTKYGFGDYPEGRE